MFSFQTFLKIFFLSAFFTLCLFLFDHIFLKSITQEEIHIDPSLDFKWEETPEQIPSLQDSASWSDLWKQTQTGSLSQAPEEISEGLLKGIKPDITFLYIPSLFQTDILEYTQISRAFLDAASIQEKIDTLQVEFYKKLLDVRGKMKSGTIKIWGVKTLSSSEFFSVFVHEFAHYVDIYAFPDALLGDISKRFYTISWQSPTIMREWGEMEDFVSGYAATNQYEDFAETFTYFLLHNSDFSLKSEKSPILGEKYRFFQDFVFLSGEFSGTDFSQDSEIKNYYWDITKIPIQVENFLQYIKNEI